jgi:hypothetical protein
VDRGAGEHVNLTPPVAGDLDREMGRGPEPVEAKSVPSGNPAQPEGPVPDDPRAEEGGRTLIRKGIGDGVDEWFWSHEALGEAAVGVVAGEFGVLAQVLLTPPTVPALPTCEVKPRHPDAVAGLEPSCPGTRGVDLAHDLMAQHKGGLGQG